MNGDDKIKTCAVLCASVSVDYVTIFDFFFWFMRCNGCLMEF